MTNSYKIKFVNPDKNSEQVLEVLADEYILDGAERQNLNLPYSCRAGVCISCTAKLLKGSVNHDYDFLQQKEIEEGFFLACKAYATSDCVVQTHQEDALLDL